MEKVETLLKADDIKQLLKLQRLLMEMNMELIKAVLHPPLIVSQEE